MFVASYHNTMRGARLIARSRDRMPMPRYGIRREWFPVVIPRASPRELIARVAWWHGVTYADIVGRSRVAHIVTARQDAMAAVRHQFPKLSLPGIARHFRRDHTTIIHGLRKVGCPTVMRKWGSYCNG